jgi:deoxyuridine 5'-triphosphate nucleotidohydrolase
MEKLIIQILRSDKVKRLNLMPMKAYDDDAGWDLRVCWPDEMGTSKFILASNEIIDVPTGISIKLPEGYWAEIKARGSSFLNRSLHIHDAVLDNGFTGEVKVAIMNMSIRPAYIEDGERLAQLILHKIYPSVFEEVELLPTTNRGTKELGSSGK